MKYPMNPRIWLAGGGYMGKKSNNHVRTMEAYTDLWYTRDGVIWTPVAYVEGETAANRYSTSNTFYVKSQKSYIGKWGHTLIPFHYVESINLEVTTSQTKRNVNVRIPALYFIAGDTVGDGSLVRTTFQTNPHINCVKAGNILYTGRSFYGPNLAVQNFAVGAATVPDVRASRKYGSWAQPPFDYGENGGAGCDGTEEMPYEMCTEESRNGMHVRNQKAGGLTWTVYDAVLQNVVCHKPFEFLQDGAAQQCGGLDKDADGNAIAETKTLTIKYENFTGLMDYEGTDYQIYRYSAADSESGTEMYHARLKGCNCETDRAGQAKYFGEYCQLLNPDYEARALRSAGLSLLGHAILVALACATLAWRVD